MQSLEKAYLCMVSGPNLVTYLNQTPILEWCLVRCGFKNRHHEDIMCLKEIGLCVQIFLTILGPTVNIIGGTYMVIQ